MIDYAKVVEQVYELCQSPSEQVLPLQRVLRFIEQVDTQLCADLDTTNQLWRVRTVPINFDPSTPDRRVEADDYSRAIMVEIDPDGTNYNRIRRRLHLVDVPDQEIYSLQFGNDSAVMPWIGAGSYVDQIGFYRKEGGELWARIGPWPRVAFRAKLWYEPGPPVDKRDEDVAGSIEAAAVAAFPLLAARAALLCLPSCRHIDAATRKEQRDAIQAEVLICNATWDIFKTEDKQAPSGGPVNGFRVGVRRTIGFPYPVTRS